MGRGMALEAYVRSQLAHPAVAEWRKLEPAVRGRSGRMMPIGQAPPDFLVVLRLDGIARYVESKEIADPSWGFALLEEHQAQAMDRLPSALVIRWCRVPHSVTHLVPWSTLGPRWWAWYRSPQRALPKTASLTPEASVALGGVDLSTVALVPALERLARSERRSAA